MPFLSGSAGSLRVLPRQEDDRLIRNDLVQLLLTGPSERIMRPDWGAPLRPFLWSQMDDVAKDRLELGIRDAVGKYEKRVTLTGVIIEFSDDNQANIKLYGYFNYDRFSIPDDRGSVDQGDLLVELGISTRTSPNTQV
jgi:phage baseplate assembly protein W